jgi:antitoxin component of MazEF toxin-antitoxin module
MGYPTKLQEIRRKNSSQFFVGLPLALVKSMELSKGDVVEWKVKDKDTLVLKILRDRG